MSETEYKSEPCNPSTVTCSYHQSSKPTDTSTQSALFITGCSCAQRERIPQDKGKHAAAAQNISIRRNELQIQRGGQVEKKKKQIKVENKCNNEAKEKTVLQETKPINTLQMQNQKAISP